MDGEEGIPPRVLLGEGASAGALTSTSSARSPDHVVAVGSDRSDVARRGACACVLFVSDMEKCAD